MNIKAFKYFGWWILPLLMVLMLNSEIIAEPLALDEALDLAFLQSPTIKKAKLNLEISERNLKANQASLKSQFSLTLSPYQYSKNLIFDDRISEYYTSELTSSGAEFSIIQPIKWTDGRLSITEAFNWQESFSSLAQSENKGSSYKNTLRFQYNQPLFTYNRTLMTQRELELALENAQLNYAIEKLQIEYRVTQEFLNLFHYQKSLQISREEFANAQESYDIILSKVNAGISAQEELYQAELTTANSRASLENTQFQYENALDEFKIFLDIPLEDKLIIEADVKKKLIDVNLNHAVSFGLANRMELRQLDIGIQNAMHDLIRTAAENEFKASIDLVYGITGEDTKFDNIFDSPTREQMVGITVNIPLFDWGEKKHKLAAKNAQIESQQLNADEEKKNIRLEIRRAYRNLQNQKTQIEIAETNVKNARLTYELNLERYKNGDLSSKDMSFYQNQLSSEQLGEVRALINYKMELLNLKIRTLWDFENNISVIDQN